MWGKWENYSYDPLNAGKIHDMHLIPRLVVPWWFVSLILGGTAVFTVSYTGGEEHTAKSEIVGEMVPAQTLEESPTEETFLIQHLRERLEELEQREQRLQRKQEQLKGLGRDLEDLAARQAKEAERLTQQAAVLEVEKKNWEKQDLSLVHLIKVYDAMDPDEAAERIEEMSEELALDILAGLKGKKAAGVLAGVKPKKAARLSEGLWTYRERKIKRN
jgi:flagellar motility protein MotE (MotC chaperone)